MIDRLKDQLPRVLVIDDNRSIHDDFRKLLSPESSSSALDAMAAELFGETHSAARPAYDVEFAQSGEAGLIKVQDALSEGKPYDLSFVDMRMPPGWDGVETIEQLWNVQPELQVVICTAFSDYGFAEIGDRLKATDKYLLLKKPFDPIEIYQLAAALTKKAELARLVRHQLDELEQRVVERTNELESAQAQLVQAEKLAAVGQLAAGIAHQINTPIQFINDNLLACAEMFENLRHLIRKYQGITEEKCVQELVRTALTELSEMERRLDVDFIFEEAPQAFAQSLEGIDRIRTIVLALKAFAQSGHAGEPTSFDLNKALDATITIADSELKRVATVEKDFGVLPHLIGRPDELNQAFLNLLINAAHAIAEKGERDRGIITVRTRHIDHELLVSISDTGCGIPVSHRPRIFEPFFTTKEVGRGSGQGLSIVHGVIKRHGGQIDFETEVGRGTTFCVRLPLNKVIPLHSD